MPERLLPSHESYVGGWPFDLEIYFCNIGGSIHNCLKKVLSIALLIVFLFNVGGYYAVFWFLRIHADKQLNYRLDSNQYDPMETIEIKVAVTLPYPIYSNDFQRVDGRFEHEGEFFKLVKHKYENDTLYIICIRDHQTRELANTLDNYVELTQALPAANDKAWSFLSKLIKDYFSHEGVNILHQYGFSMRIAFMDRTESFRQPLIPVHAPPPRS